MKKGFTLIELMIVIAIIAIIAAIAIPSLIKSKIAANEGAASGSLKTFNGMMAGYQKKRYAGLGARFPVGNDAAIANDGKFCGLYYEVNNAVERVTLIGAAEASADLRADGNTGLVGAPGAGSYNPCTNITGYNVFAAAVTFDTNAKQGYWFGLLRSMSNAAPTLPYNYDSNESRNHYALGAFPDDYGSSGENTFIINEEGTVYSLDRGTAVYFGGYPSADPTTNNWVLAN